MLNSIQELMSNKKAMWAIGIGVTIILIFGVGITAILLGMISKRGNLPEMTLDSIVMFTQAVQTIQAEYTQQAAEAAYMASETPTPIWDDSPTPLPTERELDQNLTPTETMIIPSLTPILVVCNSAQFVRDVTVMDNTPFAPDTTFMKTWRVKNTGSCTWTQDYRFVFISGNPMDTTQSISLPGNVEPNQTVDISIEMKSPDFPGSYRGDWMLSSPSGTRFGTGSSGTGTLYVAIKVLNFSNPNLVYDFAANYCLAQWQSGLGMLPCPGTSSGTEGFITLLDMPKLENRQEDELTLWTHPQSVQQGWISGMYPEFTIQSGQRFIAWVGCLSDSKGCNLNFRLDFLNKLNGNVKNLGIWHEVYDGEITVIDLDLSQHAGKTVQFILTVEIAGGDPNRANGFWFVPGIIYGPPLETQTPTWTPTPTATETPTPTDDPTETP